MNQVDDGRKDTPELERGKRAQHPLIITLPKLILDIFMRDTV